MAATSNIMSIVLIMVIVLTGWLVIQANQFNTSMQAHESSVRYHEQQKAAGELASVLEVSEPALGMSVSDMLAEMAYSRKSRSSFFGQDVNLEGRVGQILDSVYGKGNYYLEMIPPKAKIRVYFVADNSQGMAGDIDNLNAMIPEIISGIEGDYSIETAAYVMSRFPGTGCESLENAGECFDSALADYGPEGEEGTLSGENCPKEGSGIYNKYFARELKRPSSPFFLMEDAIDSNCVTGADYNRVVRGKFYKDWATATAYVAREIDEKGVESGEPTLTFIFPLSDEISTGAAADLCSTKSPGAERSYCNICTGDANRFERSSRAIGHALEVLSGYDYRVFPIAARSPQGMVVPDPLCNEDGSICTSGNCQPCCGTLNCTECPVEGLHGTPEDISQLRQDMARLAAGTGGKVIDMIGDEYASHMQDGIMRIINEAASQKFSFGTKKEGAQKYAVTRSIPMRGGKTAQVRFWLYKEKSDHTIERLPPLRLRPFVSAFASPRSLSLASGATVKAVGAAYSPNGLDVNAQWFLDGELLAGGKQPPETEFTISQKGMHTLSLRATDSDGNSSSADIAITVN